MMKFTFIFKDNVGLHGVFRDRQWFANMFSHSQKYVASFIIDASDKKAEMRKLLICKLVKYSNCTLINSKEGM